jgi:hypothetical protein
LEHGPPKRKANERGVREQPRAINGLEPLLRYAANGRKNRRNEAFRGRIIPLDDFVLRP